MSLYDDIYIGRILKNVRTISVVWVSTNDVESGFFVIKCLINKRATRFPVNYGHLGKGILGRITHAIQADIP